MDIIDIAIAKQLSGGGSGGGSGTDGFSPVVTVSEIEGGHSITIQDKTTTNTFNVMDGTDGKDGSDAVYTFDSTPTAGSTNPVTSGGVYTAIQGIDRYTFDNVPTQGSSNIVTSGSIYTAIKDVSDDLSDQSVKEVTISDTAPVITAAENTRYICGTVQSLSFTPSVSGLCEVIFTTGATVPTVTFPATVKMPDWYEVEANTTYEISILNGIYGAVMSWAV